MRQYTMLGGYKIDVETEPYDKGSFDTDYSKAIQLTIRLSANNSHKEIMIMRLFMIFVILLMAIC